MLRIFTVLARPATRRPARQPGFSLIELMIAMTLGMLVLAALAGVFVNSSRARAEVERNSQQIENGRYAMQVLSDELRLAGYLAEFNVVEAVKAGLPVPGAMPDPCATGLADLRAALTVAVQGYNSPAAAPVTCLPPDWRVNTDVVVIRRASTCVPGAAGCAAVVAGAPYFQASLCDNATELGSASVSDQYRLDTSAAGLDRNRRNCSSPADAHLYLVRIYFVADNDEAGDGIPTLKRAELGAGGFAVVPIAEGIENLQLEYGVDATQDGIPDAISADPDTVAAWRDVMSAKISLLARSTSASSGYIDNKTYAVKNGGAVNTFGPFNDPYKRHVFQSEVRLNNLAVRRAK